MRANTLLCVALSAAVGVCVAATARAQGLSEDDLVIALHTAQTPHAVQQLLNANSQTVTPKLWQRLMDVAARTYYQNHDQSFVIYDVALRIAERLGDQALIARTYYNLARSHSGLGAFDKAKEEYLRSDTAFASAGLERDRIYILSDLGTITFLQEQFAEAKSYSQASIALAEKLSRSSIPPGAWPDSFGVAGAFSTLGELSLLEGNIERAIGQFGKSMSLFEELNNSNPTYNYYLVDACAGLGRAYTSAGDYRNSLKYLNRALGMAKGAHIPNVLNSIGFLYMEQENYAQASAQFTRSLKLYEEQQNRWESARVLLNLAVVEQREGNVEDALRLFRESLSQARSVNNQDVVVAALEGTGVMLSAQGLFEPAIRSFQDALAMARQLGDRPREAEITWRESETLSAMGNYSQAADVASVARELARRVRFTKLTYLCTTTLGLIYAKQKKTQLAIETLKNAIAEIEVSRTMVAGAEEQTGLFFERRLEPYHALIELLIARGEASEALLYAERAKARVLLDIIQSGRSTVSSILSPTEQGQRQRLNQRMFELNERIKTNKSLNSPDVEHLNLQLNAVRLEYQAFEDSLYVNHPELGMRIGRSKPFTATEVNGLPANTAYLEYVITDSNVLLFVLSKTGPNSATAIKSYLIEVKPRELEDAVSRFHNRLANRHPDFSRLAHELYASLIGPALLQLKNIETLCVVPDGFLWNLPFQALISLKHRYLIEDYELSYAPSLTLLDEITTRKPAAETNNGSLIAFGNPVIGKDEERNEELCPLPEAENEVRTISKLFTGLSQKVFTGRRATEISFRSLAPTYSTIHLATHGVLDNRQPLYSHLLLTRTQGDVENDGLLEAREIMSMNLSADLTVLSACETANGRISPGEGVVGMSWAFFVAGTRSLVVSQWKVNSASTSKLMKNFYQPLVEHRENKAQALRAASLRLLKDTRYRHPFYWAAFVLVGNN